MTLIRVGPSFFAALILLLLWIPGLRGQRKLRLQLSKGCQHDEKQHGLQPPSRQTSPVKLVQSNLHWRLEEVGLTGGVVMAWEGGRKRRGR